MFKVTMKHDWKKVEFAFYNIQDAASFISDALHSYIPGEDGELKFEIELQREENVNAEAL
jgi:hypothetical protein